MFVYTQNGCMFGSYSIEELGLYDHVIYNDDVEAAYAQLVEIAARALRGGVGSAPLDSAPDSVSAPDVPQVPRSPTLIPTTKGEDACEGCCRCMRL